MASPVYTILMGQRLTLPAGSATVLGGPPAGYRWVVRDIVVTNQSGNAWIPLQGIAVFTGLGEQIYAWLNQDAQIDRVLHWEGHQVIDNPDTLQALGLDSGWGIRVTGYQLTLP